jgi:catalase
VSALSGQDAVQAARRAFGSHPGFRALHAKGTLLSGTFTATPAAAALTRAAHLQGEPVRVTARFSNGAGDPEAPDHRPDVRGLAVKFYLPDGGRTDIVAQSAPRFPVATPQEFVELIDILGAGPAAAVRLPRFLAARPRTAARLAASAPALLPPSSYAAIPYFAVHAFRWLDGEGAGRPVRYRMVPGEPARRLAPHRAARRGRDYLQQEILARVAAGPVRFGLEVQIAAPEDPVDDPSRDWPAARERVTVGTLELTGPETERERDGDVLVFDPARVTDGIELSADPVLRFRPAAYDASVRERMRA